MVCFFLGVRRPKRDLALWAVLALALCGSSRGSAQDGLYHAVPLPKFAVKAFNDQGQVGGNAYGGTQAPLLWTADAGLLDLSFAVPSGGFGVVALNNLGHVLLVGWGGSYLWNGEGLAIHIGNLSPVYQTTQGYDLNERDQIVGAGIILPRSTYPDPQYVAFLWDPDEGFRYLGDLPGSKVESGGEVINNSGLVAGQSQSYCNFYDAFVWTESSGMKGIGPPPGYPCIVDVEDMNEAGVVVGNTVKWEKPGGLPLIWHPSNGYVVLNPLPGPNGCGEALDINDHGIVVGRAFTDCSKPQTQYGFVWDEKNGFRPLADCVVLDAATVMETTGGVAWYAFINNNGQLLGRREIEPYTQYRFDPVLLGDMNCDGVVDLADLQPFLGQMLKYAGTTPPLFDGEECGWWIGDINQDALLNEDDLAPFLALLP